LCLLQKTGQLVSKLVSQGLVDRYVNDAGSHHAKRASGTQRYVDDPAANERSTIIDAAAYRTSGVRHGDNGPERPRAMGAGHFSVMTTTTVIRGKASLRLRRASDKQENQHKR